MQCAQREHCPRPLINWGKTVWCAQREDCQRLLTNKEFNLTHHCHLLVVLHSPHTDLLANPKTPGKLLYDNKKLFHKQCIKWGLTRYYPNICGFNKR